MRPKRYAYFRGETQITEWFRQFPQGIEKDLDLRTQEFLSTEYQAAVSDYINGKRSEPNEEHFWKPINRKF